MKRKVISKINCKNFFAASLCIFVLSLLSQLYVSNKLAVKGKEMVVLDQQKRVLEKEISELQLEQTKFASLSYIEEQAAKNGFIENENYVSVISTVTSTAVIPSL